MALCLHYVQKSETVCTCSQVKVADLGIARVLARAGPAGSAGPESGDGTQTGMTGGIGTWRYMAPEVVRHQKYNEKAGRPMKMKILAWKLHFSQTCQLPMMA